MFFQDMYVHTVQSVKIIYKYNLPSYNNTSMPRPFLPSLNSLDQKWKRSLPTKVVTCKSGVSQLSLIEAIF